LRRRPTNSNADKWRDRIEEIMRIVLGVDDSSFSQEAVHSVMEQFRPKGTEVQVVHAIEPISAYFSAEWFPHFVPRVEAVEQDRLKQAGALVEKVCAKLRKAGFRTSQVIVRGDARAALLDRAGEWKPDLIVVGSHGLKGLNRLLMGSVSEAVVRHAACSVQVVRVRRNARLGRPKPRTGRHNAAGSRRR
jgi:nucleotide-binding universal stress UspA family protein